jgi:hypothetical protein
MTIFPASSSEAALATRVAANLNLVHERIRRAGGDPSAIRIVAVSKTFGIDVVRVASELGLADIGENYLEELESKRATSGVPVRWHYLGALQTNKIKRICEVADVVCGVSRDVEIDKIARVHPGMSIYVQVDFTGASERNGASYEDVERLVERARSLELRVEGLMTVAPIDPAGARRAFEGTDHLAREMGLRERSMGMSDDLELAVSLGSTEVRLGRALFGPR